MTINDLNSHDKLIERNNNLTNNLVIIDGQPGCGKTMFSSIISSLNRVEILNYAFEIEFVSRLNYMNKITDDATIGLIKMFADHKLYQTMMGRETNFRFKDLSSVFNNPFPTRYFKRIFSEGDKIITDKIFKNNPILSLTTHNLLSYSEPVFKAFENRLSFIEVVRHPLYMIKQQTVNMSELTKSNPRDIDLYFNYKNHSIPYYAIGWEDLFINSNDVERAIFNINNIYTMNKKIRYFLQKKNKFLTIPFEKFVVNPDSYLKVINQIMNTEFSKKTKKILKKQKVPRNKIADGINLDIYKRYLWEPSNLSLSENEELNLRRSWVKDQGANKYSMDVLDEVSDYYEKEFLNN